MLKQNNLKISSDGLSDVLENFLDTHDKSSSSKNVKTKDNPHGWTDIISFTESPFFLNFKLYPWQKLILKIMYMGSPGNKHLRINDSETRECKNCVWNNNTMGNMSKCLSCFRMSSEERKKEVESLQEELFMDVVFTKDEDLTDNFKNEIMLIEEDLMEESDSVDGRSVKEQVKRKIGNSFTELILVLGRRSGKSRLAGVIACYEAYKLLEMGHPQKYFRNLSSNDTITILNVAVSEVQAKEALFDKIKEMLLLSPYFRNKISPGSLQQKEVRFLTPYDESVNEQLAQEGLPPMEGTVYLLSGHSNSDSLVGKTALVVIIDEMASLTNRQSSKMSDQDLYVRLKNCTLTFKHAAKIISISSPLLKTGQFYSLYERSFHDDKVLMIQLPSWVVNPTLDKEWLLEEKEVYLKEGTPHMFAMEIEARFLGGASSPLINPTLVDEAFERGSRIARAEVGDARKRYYMHVDPALNSDNYAIAIVHPEEEFTGREVNGRPSPHIYVDHIHMWEPQRRSDGTMEPFSLADIDNHIVELCKKFHIASITYDQWNSAHSIQYLQQMGLPVHKTAFSVAYTELIFKELLDLFLEGRITIYANGDFSHEASEQLKWLRKRYTKKGSRVEAMDGYHDDIPDCIAGAAHAAISGKHSYGALPKTYTTRLPFLNR